MLLSCRNSSVSPLVSQAYNPHSSSPCPSPCFTGPSNPDAERPPSLLPSFISSRRHHSDIFLLCQPLLSLTIVKTRTGYKTTLILRQTNITKKWGKGGGIATKAVATSRPHQVPSRHGERGLEHVRVVRPLFRFLAADLRPGRSRLPRSRRHQSTPRSECLD